MPAFVLSDFSAVRNAVGALGKVHGAYRAVEILGKALDEVEEPAGFDERMREWEGGSGSAYEGPDGTSRQFAKGLQTAANTKNKEDRSALLEALALVLGKLTAGQGTKALGIVLKSVGYNPEVLVLTIRVCILAMQTRGGKRVVEAFVPQIKQSVATAEDKLSLSGPLAELGKTLGDKGKDLASGLSRAAAAPVRMAKAVVESGITFLDQLKPADQSDDDQRKKDASS